MDKAARQCREIFFEKNLAALSRINPGLASLLSGQGAFGKWYQFSESRSGPLVPSAGGRPLHSLFDPQREAKRLMDTALKSGFIVLLGLGGVYHTEAALERENCLCLLVIEYNIEMLAELLHSFDYSAVFHDPRFHLLTDPTPEETENCFVNLYKPALHGGFVTVPLRTRTALDSENFSEAAFAIEKAVEKVSADYSVQSYFGLRWFSNILRNLRRSWQQTPPLPEIQKAAVCAAGPSLDIQIPLLRQRRKEFFLIATDTSFPALRSQGIKPDAVISIDCQHISYSHFMETLPEGVLLFLDLASPPLIAARSKAPFFFFGGHPLCRYLSRVRKFPGENPGSGGNRRQVPVLDTSGGNVTHTAVSLAAFLGARSIELFGADFSYPLGLCYARGSYIHALFQNQQTRLKPLESLYSSFLFRTPLEKKEKKTGPRTWYYETNSLRFYRKYLEAENPSGEAELIPTAGMGAPVSPLQKQKKKTAAYSRGSVPDINGMQGFNAADFLISYREKIEALPLPESGDAYPENLSEEERSLLNTLLPAAAAIRRRIGDTDIGPREIIAEVKRYSIKEINLVLNTL